MATTAEIQAVAKSVADVARKMKQARSQSGQVISSNQALGIDWNSQEAAEAIAEAGVSYEAADVSNALGSLVDFDNTHWATHGVNYEVMTGETPIV